MVKGLDRTLQSNIVTGRVPRLEQSAADMIRYWAQQVAHSFRVNVLGQLRGTSAPTPAGVTPGARTQAPPNRKLPTCRCCGALRQGAYTPRFRLSAAIRCWANSKP